MIAFASQKPITLVLWWASQHVGFLDSISSVQAFWFERFGETKSEERKLEAFKANNKRGEERIFYKT